MKEYILHKNIEVKNLQKYTNIRFFISNIQAQMLLSEIQILKNRPYYTRLEAASYPRMLTFK